MNLLLDNDIIYKGLCYGILQNILEQHDGPKGKFGILSAARFVISKKIKKTGLNKSAESVLNDLVEFVSVAVELDPTDTEQQLAAEFESAAQRLAVNLDVGESQLCAILIERDIPLFLTGDKRAIVAIEQLLNSHARLQAAQGRLKCLEQAVAFVLSRTGLNFLRTAICSEPMIDKALTICFGCTCATIQEESVFEGLNSYIRALRAEAASVLSK